MEVHLLILDGTHKDRKMLLPPTQFVIGRDPECHLRPTSPDVSRFHCVIARLGNQVLLRDLKSKNGTLINNQKITDTTKVDDGDILQIGPLKFRFEIKLGPGAGTSGTSSMSWLVRSPDEKEQVGLDPSQETVYADFLPPDSPRAPVGQREAEQQRRSAVAGEFLREYLSQRKKPAEDSSQ